MSQSRFSRVFRSPEEVITHLRWQVIKNGTHELSGIEEEIIVLDLSGKPLSHERFQNFLADLINSLPEGEVISGTKVDGSTLPVLKGTFASGFVQPETNTTLIEFAHAPTQSTWDCNRQSVEFTQKLLETAAQHGVSVIGGGSVPTISWDDFKENGVVIPNEQFAYSWGHMMNGTRDEYCRTVFGTASIHHNTGFNNPEIMAQYITTSLRIQPTMIALLGNAPYWDCIRATFEGEPLLSHRSRVQIDYGHIFGEQDGVTYLYPDFLIDMHADFASIINGYLDLPLDRTIVDGKKVECNGLTMRRYLEEGFELEGKIHYPTEDALTMMIREPIVDVRPSFTGAGPRVEARAHDTVSQRISVSIDAFYRGINANLEEAHQLMAGISHEDIRRARHEVCEHGLATSAMHADSKIATQQDLAKRLLSIAERGLLRRGRGEEDFLSPLIALAESGRNPSQRLLAVCGEEGSDIKTLLGTMSYDQAGFVDGTSSYAWPARPEEFEGYERKEVCVL